MSKKSKKGWDLWRIAEAGLGIYLILPSFEDMATGGTTIAPSALIGGAMLAHAFGFEL